MAKTTNPLSHPLSVNHLCWFIFLFLVAHMVEEFPRFPEWATRHFGTTTTRFYVLSHIPLLIGVFWIVYRGSRDQRTGVWISLAVLVQWALFINGLFHITTTLVFREYSPGLVTGLVLYLPFTIYFLRRIIRDGYLSRTQLAISCIGGTVLAVLIISSLWLHMAFV